MTSGCLNSQAQTLSLDPEDGSWDFTISEPLDLDVFTVGPSSTSGVNWGTASPSMPPDIFVIAEATINGQPGQTPLIGLQLSGGQNLVQGFTLSLQGSFPTITSIEFTNQPNFNPIFTVVDTTFGNPDPSSNNDLSVLAVPEPSSTALLLGVASLLFYRRRR